MHAGSQRKFTVGNTNQILETGTLRGHSQFDCLSHSAGIVKRLRVSAFLSDRERVERCVPRKTVLIGDLQVFVE